MKFPTTILFILLMTFSSVKVDFQDTELFKVSALNNTRISVRASFSCYLNETWCLYGNYYDQKRERVIYAVEVFCTDVPEISFKIVLNLNRLYHANKVSLDKLLFLCFCFHTFVNESDRFHDYFDVESDWYHNCSTNDKTLLIEDPIGKVIVNTSSSHHISTNMTNTGKGTCWFPLLDFYLSRCQAVSIFWLILGARDRIKKPTVNWRSSNGTILAKAVVLVEEPMDPVPPPPPPPSPPPPKTTINVTETFFCDLPGTFCIIGYYYEEKKNYLIERALNNTGLFCTNATEIRHNILLNLDKFGDDEHYQNNSVCSYFYHNCTTTNETLTFDHSLGYPIANSTIIQNSTWNLVDYGYFSVGVPTVEARLFMPPMLYAFVTRHNINPEQLQTPTVDWITSDPF